MFDFDAVYVLMRPQVNGCSETVFQKTLNVFFVLNAAMECIAEKL